MPEPIITRTQELVQLGPDRLGRNSAAVFTDVDDEDLVDEFPTYITFSDWRKFGRPVFIRVVISSEEV